MIPKSGNRFPACAKPRDGPLIVDGCFGGRRQVEKDHAQKNTAITHVPYRGSGPAMQDLLGGRIDYICEQVSTAIQQVRAGTVKAIATMGLSRADVLPDLKTATEEGFDINCASLSAFEFPKGTPEAIVNRLAEATNKVAESAFVRERFATLGIAVEPPERRTREYYVKSLPPEVERQAVVMKANGLTAD